MPGFWIFKIASCVQINTPERKTKHDLKGPGTCPPRNISKCDVVWTTYEVSQFEHFTVQNVTISSLEYEISILTIISACKECWRSLFQKKNFLGQVSMSFSKRISPKLHLPERCECNVGSSSVFIMRSSTVKKKSIKREID